MRDHCITNQKLRETYNTYSSGVGLAWLQKVMGLFKQACTTGMVSFQHSPWPPFFPRTDTRPQEQPYMYTALKLHTTPTHTVLLLFGFINCKSFFFLNIFLKYLNFNQKSSFFVNQMIPAGRALMLQALPEWRARCECSDQGPQGLNIRCQTTWKQKEGFVIVFRAFN